MTTSAMFRFRSFANAALPGRARFCKSVAGLSNDCGAVGVAPLAFCGFRLGASRHFCGSGSRRRHKAARSTVPSSSDSTLALVAKPKVLVAKQQEESEDYTCVAKRSSDEPVVAKESGKKSKKAEKRKPAQETKSEQTHDDDKYDENAGSGSGGISGSREEEQEEAYALAVTCKVCECRTIKYISKKEYHHGVVIVTCLSCVSKHLIADRLGCFGDERNIEQIMHQQGEQVVLAGDTDSPATAATKGQVDTVPVVDPMDAFLEGILFLDRRHGSDE